MTHFSKEFDNDGASIFDGGWNAVIGQLYFAAKKQSFESLLIFINQQGFLKLLEQLIRITAIRKDKRSVNKILSAAFH